ncbi:MAG: DMT family transporter, partial [Pseudomonadota bacterium]
AAAPWRYGVIGGLFAAYFVLMFEALRRADAVPLAAVFTLTPAMGALCGWLLLAQRTSPRAALAIALGAAGALWVVFRGDWAAAAAFDVGAGEALYFVGCALHALYAALVRRLNRGEPAVVFALGSFLGAMLVALAWGGGALVATDWAALPPVAWIAIVYLGLGATAGSFLLMRYGAMRLPAGKVTAYGYAVPVFVILWEGLATGQWVALAVLPGVALIAAALAVLVAEHDRA